MILLGFLPSYVISFKNLSFIHHFHAFSAFLWLLLLNIQSHLIVKRLSALHRVLGLISLSVSLILFTSLCAIYLTTFEVAMAKGAVYQLVYWIDLFLAPAFICLVVTAYIYRRTPGFHFRNIFLSVLVLLPPGLGRFIYGIFLFPFELPLRYFYEPMMIVTISIIYFVGKSEGWQHQPTKIVFVGMVSMFMSSYLVVYSGLFS